MAESKYNLDNGSKLVYDLLDRYVTDADGERSNIQQDRMDMYLDDYSDQITTLLKKQFSAETFAYMYPMIAQYDNVFKKIINLKSQNYKDIPARKWIDTNGEESENYSEVIHNSNLESEGITLEKWAFANNVAFMRINVVDDAIRYEAIAPENISIEQDDKNPWKFHSLKHRIIKNSTSGRFKDVWHIWTDGLSEMDTPEMPAGFYLVHDQESGEEKKVPNPYVDPKTSRGIIPYVEFRTVRGTDFWSDTINEDLRMGTLQINVLQCHLNNLMKWYGYRQLFITGKIDENKLKKQKSDVGVAFAVEPVAGQQVPTIQSEEFANDPNILLEAISRIKSILADNHGVSFSADALASGQRQTAEAMTINRQQLIELRREVLPLFRESEHRMAWYTVIIANTPLAMAGLGKSIDIEGSFMIDYQEPKFIMDEMEELQLDLLKEKEGIISKADVMIKYNPDIKSEDDAIDKAKRNKEITAEMSGFSQVDEINQAVEEQGINVTLPENG